MSTTHTEQDDGRESSVGPAEANGAATTAGDATMGVASTCSRKRRLEDHEPGVDEVEKIGDELPLTKVAKPSEPETANSQPQLEDSTSLDSSSNSDFLTTSILARTLLTTTAISNPTNTSLTSSCPPSPSKTNSSFPFPISSCRSCEVINDSHNSLIESTSSTAKLESMVQQLTEQPIRPITPFTLLPSPILDSLEELRSLSSGGSSDDDLGFNSFLSSSNLDNNNGGKSASLNCCSNGLRIPSGRTVTILSPIDADEDDDDEWTLLNSVTKFKTSDITNRTSHSSLKTTASLMAVSILNDDDSQVITEDENGKSYFNLGASEVVTLARKNSTSSTSSSSASGDDSNRKNWYDKTEAANNDDSSSTSSSCDSISSEDLFNSCEDFDPSDDDDDDEDDEDAEDERNYKQMRSNILHLSLCKLNMYRTQQCVEPSLHRSVLICNTLRHIEQEIRTEDEIRQDEAFVKSREKLPSFWPKTNHISHQQQQAQNNARQNRLQMQQQQQQPTSVSLAHGKPPPPPANPSNTMQGASSGAPYMSSPNPYSSMDTAPSPPLFSSYDYNHLRPPSQTPFHSISYDEYSSPLLDHQSINGNNVLPNTSSPNSILPKLTDPLTPPSSPSTSLTLFECDSAYGGSEDMDLSSYYFGTSITSSSAGSTCSSSSFDFPTTSTGNSGPTTTNSDQSVSTSSTDVSNDKLSNALAAGSTPTTSVQSSTPLTPPPPSDISDIICSSIDSTLTTMTPSNARNQLPSSSSSSVEIELCSNRIISNEYSSSNNENYGNGKMEPTLVATTTTIWSSTNIKPLSPVQSQSSNSNGSLQQSFAQECSSQQCGIESRLTDYGLHGHHHGMMNGHHGHSPHHQHLLPMDNLISASYSIDS